MTPHLPQTPIDAVDVPIVFVHGFGCSGQDWDAQLRYFASRCPTLAVDVPGHGKAPPLSGKVTIEHMAEAVRDAISKAGIGKRLLVGHSLGTKIIREVYSQDPGSVRGLVLVDGSTYVGDAEILCGDLRRRIADAGFQRFLEMLFADMFLPGTDREMVTHIVERARSIDPAFAEALLMASIRWDIEEGDAVLRRIDVPTVLIQTTYFKSGFGRQSLSENMRTPFMEKIAAMVRHSTVTTIPGTGHFPMIEAADIFNGILEEFRKTSNLAERAEHE